MVSDFMDFIGAAGETLLSTLIFIKKSILLNVLHVSGMVLGFPMNKRDETISLKQLTCWR